MPDPSLGDGTVSVSQLAAATRVEWHEAVALVRQAGLLALAAGANAGLPDPARIWLEEDGSLSIDQVVGKGDFLTSQLAELLATVLPPSAPQELQELSDSQNPNVTSAAPQEFVEALTFFARPDDSAALRVLWARATEARQAEGRAAALHELTERTRHAAPASSSLPAMVRKSLPVRRLAMVGAAVCVLAFSAAGALLLTRRAAASNPGQSGVPTVTQEVAQSVQLSIASATAFVRESIEGVPDAPAGRGSDLKLPAPRRRPKPLASDTTAALAPPAPAAAEAAVPDAAIAGGGVPLARELPFTNGTSHALAAAPHGVYSASYPDVIPPALVRAQMPELPIGGVSMARPGALELLVGDDGQVVSAKLIPASNRHQDRMMVSAAKAWRFTPATRNGEPVSYRLQMPITW